MYSGILISISVGSESEHHWNKTVNAIQHPYLHSKNEQVFNWTPFNHKSEKNHKNLMILLR